MKYKIEYTHKEKDFEDVYNIEKKYFQESTIATPIQTISWDNKNPDIHIFIRDTIKNKIIGEITLLPLSKSQFDKFINNELEDTEINSNTLLSYKKNSHCHLLLSAIAIDPNYRKDKLVLGLLLKGLKNKLDYLFDNNIKIINMCAEGQTIEGQKFIENFINLKYKCLTKDGFKIYSFQNTKDLNKWLILFPKYIKNYYKRHNLDI